MTESEIKNAKPAVKPEPKPLPIRKQESAKQIEKHLIASKVTKTDIIEFAKPKVLPPIQPIKKD